MKLVIDTSCILAVLLNESSRQSIIDSTLGRELIAPEVMHAEFGNALSALFKKNRIDIVSAKDATLKFEQLPISFKPINVSRSLEIAYHQKIYAYDAYFLDVCIRYQLPLLTLDKIMAEKARLLNIETIDL